MKILALKPYHDGNISYIADGSLIYHYEAEKNSFDRHESVTSSLFISAIKSMGDFPDVIAHSGWRSPDRSLSPYSGLGDKTVYKESSRIFGQKIEYFSSSHERSHVLMAYGMSPFPQGQLVLVYVLVWEGGFGDFYEVDRELNIKSLGRVLEEPGFKYAFMYHLADSLNKPKFELRAAGKLMALCAYSSRGVLSKEEQEFADLVLNRITIRNSIKHDYSGSPFYNVGVDSKKFCEAAGKVSDLIFDKFYNFAKLNLTKGYPLLISGGCGLNCEWNTKWLNSGLFSGQFVPPCCNDSGAAIGTAIDAQLHFMGNAKINWKVHCGEAFENDCDLSNDYDIQPLDLVAVANLLLEDKIIGWVQGRCEMGPRALGGRSILSAPFKQEARVRLNNIKKREQYRPIAPVCLEEDVGVHFEWAGDSPYMLYFQEVRSKALAAISHVDRSARVQTVNEIQNVLLYRLLLAFKEFSGYGVLCNTSLNFSGRGFINRLSHLADFQKEYGLDGFVVDNYLYLPK